MNTRLVPSEILNGESIIFTNIHPGSPDGIGYGNPVPLQRSFSEAVERLLLTQDLKLLKGVSFDEWTDDVQKSLRLRTGDLPALPSVNALNLRTNEMGLVPVGLFGNGTGLTDLFGSVDSSGTACHPDRKEAFRRSILEFAERQSIISRWRMNTPAQRVKSPEILDRDLPPDAKVTFLNVSIFRSVDVILGLYCNNNSRAKVKYAASASADFNIERALDSTRRELTQAKLNMVFNVSLQDFLGDSLDEIQKGYLLSNSSGSYDTWMGENLSTATTSHSTRDQGQTDLKSLVDEICQRELNVYLFESEISLSGKKYWISSIASLDYWLGLNDVSRVPSALRELGDVISNRKSIAFG